MTVGLPTSSGRDRGYAVFVVDGHDLTRRGLAGLIDDHPRLRVAGEARCLAQARNRVPAAAPDIAVLDADLPDGTGLELCHTLTAAAPRLRCVLWSLRFDPGLQQAALAAGACGYVGKGATGRALTEALTRIGDGAVVLDHPGEAAEADPFAGLTAQARRVLELLAQGLTNRQIGTRLGLAEKTVKNYVSRILATLGVASRTQAAILVTEHTLTVPRPNSSQPRPPAAVPSVGVIGRRPPAVRRYGPAGRRSETGSTRRASPSVSSPAAAVSRSRDTGPGWYAAS